MAVGGLGIVAGREEELEAGGLEEGEGIVGEWAFEGEMERERGRASPWLKREEGK